MLTEKELFNNITIDFFMTKNLRTIHNFLRTVKNLLKYFLACNKNPKKKFYIF